MQAINIIWDTDGINENLPESISLPRSLFYSDIETISDYLSEQTGFCHKGFDLVRDKTECQKLIDDAIKLNLLSTSENKIFVFKSGIEDMVLVTTEEAVNDLYSDPESQEFFVEKINQFSKRKQIYIDGAVEVPNFVSEEEFTEKFLEFIESNYWSFGGGIKEE